MQNHYLDNINTYSRLECLHRTHVIVFLIVVLTAAIAGCAPTTRSSWEPNVWHVQEPGNNVPEVGTLQDAQFDYYIIVTDLRKVVKSYAPQGYATNKHPKALIAVAVKCRNKSNGTLVLDADPIQMIDASQTLAKKLTREEVIFKLYGGRMRESSQRELLQELKKPIRTSSTFFGAILAGYIAAQKADTRAFIIDEMYQKEYTTYDIFHHSFEPSSLPSGVSADWVQYYHYTPGPIKIILQGQDVSEGLTLASPPEPKLASKKNASAKETRLKDSTGALIAAMAAMAASAIILGFLIF